jgi:hypothetical protein
MGAVTMLVLTKNGVFHRKKEVSQLKFEHEKEVDQLQLEKLNLKNRNGDLVQIISQNNQEINRNKRDIKELKEAVAILSHQTIQCLELLASVTKIQGQAEEINAQIVITKRFSKKYQRFLNFSDAYTND